MPKDLPSPETLRKLLRYEPETGKLFWKRRGACGFSSAKSMNAWNARYAGKDAFTSRGGASGWHQGAVWGRLLLAHRVAWAIHYGEWPKKQIDHINGDASDNRIENLRDVDHAENMKNRRVHKNSKSGVIGVYWCKSSGSWRADILVNGKKHHLGRFAKKDAAAAARKSAEKKFGFHPNHGRKS